MRYIKAHRKWGPMVLGLLVAGILVVGIMPTVLRADNPQEAPKFSGYTYDESGTIKPNTDVYVYNLCDPTEVWTTRSNASGYYEVFLCNGCQSRSYVINYGTTPYYYGTGVVSPPAQVDIHPDQWKDFSEMLCD